MQGAFREHARMLNDIDGVTATTVRTVAEMGGLDGLVLPGGESTTIGMVAERSGVLPALRAAVREQRIPVFATCAGLIMLAEKALGQKVVEQPLIGGLGVVVDRNHFGSQLNSFETEIQIEEPILVGDQKCHGLFIRAPAIVEITAPDVKVLARLSPEVLKSTGAQAESKGECIVAAAQGNVLVTAFHPELTPDARWHQYFVGMIKANKAAASA